MHALDLNPHAMQLAAGSIPDEAPCVMLNLLRYRERADYGEKSDAPACSGREAYFKRYVPAFGRLAAAGIAPVWIGRVAAALVAPTNEHWDDVALVRYPSFRAFRDLVESDAYREQAQPHRLAALAEWRLIASVEMSMPDAPAVGDAR